MLLFGPGSIAAANGGDLTPAAQAEIAHLLDYLDASGCQFLRGGTWHDAHASRAHVETKYRFVQDRNLVGSAEEFIDKAVTASSVTGVAYQVRCGSAAPVASATWLKAELDRLRAQAAVRR